MSWGGAPRLWASLPSYLALLTRGDAIRPDFYARQRCNSRGWHLVCLSTWSYSLLGHTSSPPWSGGVLLSRSGELGWSTLLGVRGRGVYSSTPWEGHPPRSRMRPGLALRPNSGIFTTSRRQVPGPHRPSRRHSLWPGVSSTALQLRELHSQRVPDLLPE